MVISSLRYVVLRMDRRDEFWRGAVNCPAVSAVELGKQLAPGKTLGRTETHSYARKYAKSTGALKHAARNRYTAGKISGKVCCTQSAATYKPPPSNPANDK